MSQVLDESSERPTGTGDAQAEGLHVHPGRISLRSSGWAEPIGYFNEMHWKMHTSKNDKGSVDWKRLDIPCLFLSKTAALLLVQGMPLTGLFPPDFRLAVGAADVPGSFGSKHILLRAEPPLFLDPPPKVRHVVLGFVYEQQGLSDEEVLSLLVQEALA